MILTDELLEKLAFYYTHPFTQENMGWITALSFEQFVERYMRDKERETFRLEEYAS